MKTKIPVLLSIMILMLFVCQSWKVFNYPPKSVHQWRQSDCAAYVKTYYRTGSNLMQPATFNLAGKEGRVISEFPIIYYASAKIQHLVGEHYWVVRGLTFLCFLTGLIALLSISSRWIKHPVLTFFPVLLLATSPYYYYYAINFLPNIPAISFSLLGLFFFLKYLDGRKGTILFWGTLCFILATALKPTDGGILWLAFMAAIVCDGSIRKKEGKSPFIPFLLSSLIIIGCIFSWANYANWYNDQNGNHQNLLGIYPIWDMDYGLIKYTKQRVIDEWSNVYQQKIVLCFVGLMLLFFIGKWKKLDTFLKWFTLWTIFGTLAYSILWFKAFTDHDYYQLPLMLPALCLSITMLAYFDNSIIDRLSPKLRLSSYSLLIFLMIVGLFHNKNIQKERYTKSDYVYINPALYKIEPYLKTLGIKEHDAVVCVPDKSPNMSLNAINRYGYSEEFNSESYNINTFKSYGAAYLIVSDSSYINNPLYAPFTKKQVGVFNGIYIFDMR